MLIGEVIQRIQSLYSKGIQSDDSNLTPRHIYNKMLTVRVKLINQKASKKQKINQWNYQTIPCAELIKAPLYECECLPLIDCNKVLKTKQRLPKPLTNFNNHLIQSVTSLDGSIIFSEISWQQKTYKSGNKYTSKKPDYYIKDNFLYITDENEIKAITITGIFEDPLEADKYPNFCDKENDDCLSPLERVFPMDYDQIDTLVEIAVNELIILFSQNKEDLTNNTRDSNVESNE